MIMLVRCNKKYFRTTPSYKTLIPKFFQPSTPPYPLVSSAPKGHMASRLLLGPSPSRLLGPSVRTLRLWKELPMGVEEDLTVGERGGDDGALLFFIITTTSHVTRSCITTCSREEGYAFVFFHY